MLSLHLVEDLHGDGTGWWSAGGKSRPGGVAGDIGSCRLGHNIPCAGICLEQLGRSVVEELFGYRRYHSQVALLDISLDSHGAPSSKKKLHSIHLDANSIYLDAAFLHASWNFLGMHD